MCSIRMCNGTTLQMHKCTRGHHPIYILRQDDTVMIIRETDILNIPNSLPFAGMITEEL